MKKLFIIIVSLLFLFVSNVEANRFIKFWETTHDAGGGGGVQWDFLDTFSTDLPAGSVNSTLSDSGHTRTVTDTESKVSISGGNLVGAAMGAAAYGLTYGTSFTRVAGRLITSKISVGTGAFVIVGYNVNSSPTTVSNSQDVFYFRNTELVTENNSTPIVGTYTAVTSYYTLTAQRASGSFAFILGGSQYPKWKLIKYHAANSLTPVYPVVYTGVAGSAFTVSYLGIPTAKWLPTPLLSHGFASVVTPSDGTGHLETTGIGSGGGSVTLTDVGGTWSISGEKAVNTPTTGAELLSDLTFDAACDGAAGHWACSSANWTIGSGVATKTTGASASLYQYPGTVTAGKWYTVSAYLSPTGSSAIDTYIGGTFSGLALASAGAGTKTFVARPGNTNNVSFAGGSLWSGTLDNATQKELTLNTLFLTAPVSTSNVVASVDLVVNTATPAGLVLRLNSASTPTKGLIAYTDGTNCKLDQFTTATTWTNLISAACTYSTGKSLLVDADGVNVRLYYNNVLIGTTASVDAGITGMIHGLFSTSALNSIDNLVIYPKGNEGQFSNLEAFVLP